MISPEEALDLVVQTASVRPPWLVALQDACGLSLAEDVLADRDQPPFPRSMMDGFAVRLADAGTTVPVAGEIAAGSVWPGQLGAGQCLEILTGAPCPPGTEAVVQKEQVRRQENCAALPSQIEPGQNIAAQGSECCAGQRVLAAGQLAGPLEIAVMAAFGVASVRVIPRPTLGIITTGGELVSSEQPPGPGQIRDCNGPMLAAMARDLGIEKPPQWHAADCLKTIGQTLHALATQDVIVLAGGVSVGTYDLVPRALSDYGAETVFHGVRQKPGKPLLLARKDRQLIFGLPGNPLACHLGFHRYVAAALRKMMGRPAVPPRFDGELVEAVQPKRGRTHFVPARAAYAPGSRAAWRIGVLPGVSSADVFHSCGANCYVEMQPGNRTLEAGDICAFTWLSNASDVA